MIILECYSSKPDTYGNSYHYCHARRDSMRCEFSGSIPGNIKSALYDFFGSWDALHENVHFIEVELPIREFNRRSKGLPYGGCTTKEIQATLKGAGILW